MQFVYADLSKGGLGNKLLVWTRAYAFSKKHSIELITSSWYTFSLGPFLRLENKKRLYWNYFKKDKLSKQLKYLFLLPFRKRIYDPSFDELIGDKCIYVFRNNSYTNDYFFDLKPFRNDIRGFIFENINPKYLSIFKSLKKPVIGIHIRRGDFKFGSTITPEKYFYDCVLSIRQYADMELPVTVFTDANSSEIELIKSLPEVTVFNSDADIIDILSLASSKIAIISIGSTFSFWGAFLSDGIILKHPSEWHSDIRPKCINDMSLEYLYDPLMPMNESLKKAIKNIPHDS